MRALGIDFGESRIGLAVSDPDGRLAVPLETFERTNDRKAVGKIRAVARSEKIDVLVLGDPVHLDGRRGEMSDRVRRFGAKLREATDLPVHLVPEALTSVEARRRLEGAGVDVRAHPERLDAAAAQILLEEFFTGAGTTLAQ